MASEKKARKMGYGEKDVHVKRTYMCAYCSAPMIWVRNGETNNMVWWCESCGRLTYGINK